MRTTAFALLGAAFCCAPVLATQTATIRGVAYVDCARKLALPHARVRIASPAAGTRVVMTDAAGRFHALGLPSGRYSLRLDTREGLAERTVVLDPDDVATIELGYEREGTHGNCTAVRAHADPPTQDKTVIRNY